MIIKKVSRKSMPQQTWSTHRAASARVMSHLLAQGALQLWAHHPLTVFQGMERQAFRTEGSRAGCYATTAHTNGAGMGRVIPALSLTILTQLRPHPHFARCPVTGYKLH